MRICIDAGHNYSGYDTGAQGNGLKEQDVTFAIADRLKKLLAGAGVEVTMTRGEITDNVGVNTFDSINERARLANNTKCDYFISIHCNSSANRTANGTETLVYGFGGQAEKLALKVNNSVVKKLALKDRGVKVRTDLGVLRLTNMPAILVETAFISNEKDAMLLKNNTDDFAQAIFEGFRESNGGVLMGKDEVEEIIDIVSGIVEINDKGSAVSALSKAKSENTSLYWILKKLADKYKEGENA